LLQIELSLQRNEALLPASTLGLLPLPQALARRASEVLDMKRLMIAIALAGNVWLASYVLPAQAAPCLIVTHGTGPKIDAVCSPDTVSQQGFTISCTKFVTHIADAFVQSGEVAQRHSEPAGGPAELVNTVTFEPKDEPQLVWSVRSAPIRSTHIPGHVSYRVDAPAGSVVIGCWQ
jgi:hypothetical protein